MLDPNLCRVVAVLIREYGRVLCDAQAARVMLKASSDTRRPIPELWQETLDTAKNVPQIARIAQEFETIALRLESNASETDLTELLKRIQIKTPIN
jgi:hypothetical protein